MACAYLWEICDALGTEHWTRRSHAAGHVRRGQRRPADGQPARPGAQRAARHGDRHAAASLLRLDYPRYEIILIDDNTDDEALWRPVEAWCRRHSVKFVHLADWPGYKSGALNYALREMTDPRGRGDRRRRLRLPDRAGVPAPLRAGLRRAVGRLRPVAAGLPGLGALVATTGGCTTPTSTSSPSPSPRATSATARSSPARWGSSAGSRSSSSAAGTSGASPRTPSCRCACSGQAGPGCMWTSRGGTASCR